MLEPFIWMFKTPDFKQNYIKLVVSSVILLVIGILIMHFSLAQGSAVGKSNLFLSFFVLPLISIICTALPFIMLQGYFWELTSNIIDRNSDLQTGSVYNGKFKEINKITLPEWDMPKFVWRGIASAVATIIMALPWTYIIILYIAFNVAPNYKSMASVMANIGTIGLPLVFLMLLYIFFIPGLLWNYASQNSVFAALNIPKAIYIAGNYTTRYIVNGFLFFIVSAVYTLIISLLSGIFGIQQNLQMLLNIENLIPYIIFQVLFIIMYSFVLHIYAYLLGTLTPPSEA